MRALLIVALLAPLALAQDAGQGAPPAVRLEPPAKVPGAALPADAEWQTTASGLRYAIVRAGDPEGVRPAATDYAKVYYAGYLEDGTKFDSRQRPLAAMEFTLEQVIDGWTEVLQLMTPGAAWKVHIPAALAYGADGSPPLIPGDANLIFDIELLAARPGPPAFEMPKPADLHATASGLQYCVLDPGKAEGRKPTATDTVSVVYSVWLTDGRLCDTSLKAGQPATFRLNGVIKGWTEGLQLMTEGAVWKFVVPPDLAYGAKGRGGIPPNATLVFQVQLVKVGA